jgi:hypothetical protein
MKIEKRGRPGPRPDRRIDPPTVHLSRNVLISTCTKALVGLAMTRARRNLDNLNSTMNHCNPAALEYQRLILETNGGGERNPNHKGYNYPKQYAYVEHKGIPCFKCEKLIPIGYRIVRRRAGSSSKYYHTQCFEKIFEISLPVTSEAEMESMRLGLYPPAMHIPSIK